MLIRVIFSLLISHDQFSIGKNRDKNLNYKEDNYNFLHNHLLTLNNYIKKIKNHIIN
jgi:hypothetical protein